MRLLAILILLYSGPMSAQKDSTHKVRVEISMPVIFTSGLTFQTMAGTSNYARHLISNSKSTGGYQQWLGTQVHFFDKVFVEVAFMNNGIGYNKKDALKQLQDANPDHFIQEESIYQTSSGTTYGSDNLNYFRLGLGVDIKIKHYRYVQPRFVLCTGKARLPSGEYAFKEYSSNMYYIKEYKLPKSKCNGFSLGISYKWYIDTDEPSKTLANFGLTADFTYLNTSGKGTITSTDAFKNKSEIQADFRKTYKIFSVGIILGLSNK